MEAPESGDLMPAPAGNDDALGEESGAKDVSTTAQVVLENDEESEAKNTTVDGTVMLD